MTVDWVVCNGSLARVAGVNQWLLHQRTRLGDDKVMVMVLAGDKKWAMSRCKCCMEEM